MTEIVFLNDALMARESFEGLPMLISNGASIVEAAQRAGGKLCRALIERDGRPQWHAIAVLYLNGAERIAAARVKLGRYQSEN